MCTLGSWTLFHWKAALKWPFHPSTGSPQVQLFSADWAMWRMDIFPLQSIWGIRGGVCLPTTWSSHLFTFRSEGMRPSLPRGPHKSRTCCFFLAASRMQKTEVLFSPPKIILLSFYFSFYCPPSGIHFRGVHRLGTFLPKCLCYESFLL